MSEFAVEFGEQYARALQDYLAQGQERFLQQAYELGRRATSGGLGLMDMARIPLDME